MVFRFPDSEKRWKFNENSLCCNKKRTIRKFRTVRLVRLFVFFKELLHEFDVLIGHICYGVGVGAVEVDEPRFCDELTALGGDGFEPAFTEPAVDGVISVAGGGDNFADCEGVGQGFEFLFEPSSEVRRQRGRKSCFAWSGFSWVFILCGGEFGVGRNVFFGVFGRVLYVGEQVFFQYDIFSCSLAGVVAFDEAVVEHPSALAFTDMQGKPYLFS